ncbi:O-succinylbenzoate synthase [hydrothermal vent metagenome]|uniref:O-succinylbenzoate synthase n=1 Tax=hydrothermal vent metagenome TaxID=652676 RepID=A0A3B1BMF1_9ZZZZ
MNAMDKITRANWQPYCLPLRQPWQTAKAEFSQRRGWLIQLHDEAGHVGLGDCAPLPEAGTESWQQAETQLAERLPLFRRAEPELLLAELDACQPTPAARCGLEMALVDLLAQQKNISVAKWLNADARDSVAVNQNAGTLTKILSSGQHYQSGIVKLKVGLEAVAEELAQLRTLVQRYPDLRFRLDANQAWNPAEAEQFIRACAALPSASIESIEEPLMDPGVNSSLDSLADLQTLAAFPLALDESLVSLETSRWLSSLSLRRVVLKPMREGGILRVKELAEAAQSAAIECVLTTTVDSAVGVMASLHLAAALTCGETDLVHGLATSDWLAEDLGPVLPVSYGRIYLPDGAGFGIDPDQITLV